ncbi:MAG: PAS domain S-box protein [Sphingomonas sp.]|uniref:MHYT domain-containing protein n=1 Tax=Sphingomonas sp. TaxID=28214 RepID=UPI0022745FF8|nr:MHYT domain-containing protein [Sphingomonas sp.]MCX8475581.1 PAS domain S-box protein [Sphingomonas sp.]
MSSTHDPVLVCISILIAVAASYTALDLAGRIRASQGWLRRVWLATAAVAMGGGIWAMHFVAMLAFRMPGMHLDYHVGLTLLSFLVAVVVTGAGFAVMSRARGALPLLGAAGAFMGLGIVAMHYLGMAAMQMAAELSYHPLWLGISVVVAVGAATAALWLASRDQHPAERIGAAVLMGIAIAGMHFAGMRAAIFTMLPGAHMIEAPSVSQTTLAISVSMAAFLILFLALVAAMFDRRFALLAQREAEALRRSEEQFRALYRGTPLPLHALDPDGHIEHVSDAWIELLGYAREEVVGRPLINFLTEASARQLIQRDWPELLAAGALDQREYRVVTKSGAFLDVVSAARVERDAAGGFVHVVGGLTDVTDRKLAEEALRQAQKLEAIGQLTGGIAHDFNNLLTVILGNLELLRKRLPDDPRTRRLVENAFEGAQRGASLTQRLLAFARRQDLRPEPIAVAELVRGMTSLLQHSLGPMVRVETHFPLGLPPAQVDANQLEMALLNLAMNARDAMPDGGIIDISATERAVDGEFADLAAGRYVKLVLSDTGFGMDEETLARAVDPFFTTKGVGKGTGLGLSMVQGLVAQSGGRLTLRSALGRGTVAELYLPVAEGAEQALPAPPLPAPMPSRRLTVLAVDDDALVLANTAAMLEDLGHRVIPAVTASEALGLLRGGLSVDLVVTDQLMPEMTGLELATAIIEAWPRIPVLLVTGLVDFEVKAGQSIRILGKPFAQDDLATAIRDVAASASVIRLKQRRES